MRLLARSKCNKNAKNSIKIHTKIYSYSKKWIKIEKVDIFSWLFLFFMILIVLENKNLPKNAGNCCADFRMSEMQAKDVEDLHKGQNRCVFFVGRCEWNCDL